MDPQYVPFSPFDMPPSVLIVLIAFWIALAVGNGFIARELHKHVALWVVLSLIPIVNTFFYIYIVYAVVLGVLHRLNAIAARGSVVIDT
jgi:hypothetical protein